MKGYRCPYRTEEDHDDEEEEKEWKESRQVWADAGFRDITAIGHRTKELVRRKKPRLLREVPYLPDITPEEVPPIAAIARGFVGRDVKARVPGRDLEWEKRLNTYLRGERNLPGLGREISRAARTVKGQARQPSTTRRTVKSSERAPVRSPRVSSGFRGVMGKAEQLFTSSLPTPAKAPKSSSSKTETSKGSSWRGRAAAAAVAGTAAGAALYIKSRPGPPAGGGYHQQAPKFRGGGRGMQWVFQ